MGLDFFILLSCFCNILFLLTSFFCFCFGNEPALRLKLKLGSIFRLGTLENQWKNPFAYLTNYVGRSVRPR